MAKKISKHSRAARRGEIESAEARELSQVPKQESDAKKAIIRSTILSENLLAKRLENRKNRNKNKKVQKNLTSRNRTSNLGGILSTKIENSKARYNFVSSSRKAGWDKINEDIKKTTVPQEEKKDVEQEEEDEYVRQFFEDSNSQSSGAGKSTGFNKFALLEESEA